MSKLLLVDDDDLLRVMMADALGDFGWDVTCAKSGDDAKRLLDAGADFHTMVTDVRMPGVIDGVALARFAQSACDAMRIVVISGYLGNDTNAVTTEKLGKFLAKPFTMSRLAEELQTA